MRQTLSNAISSGQIAHAYLFCGPRGTGKTSAAKLFAKAINCLRPNGSEPCNECDACLSITRGNNVDVEEIDAASNRGVDEIRELRDKVHYLPTSVRRKVYIVDEVHMLTTEAFNALLKTLEEPPGHVVFLLATTEAHRLPSTIVSRCQRFDFHRIATETIVGRLEDVVRHEQWTAEPSALWKLAEAADGGLRDALGLLEQAAAFGQGTVSEGEVAAVVGGVDTHALLDLVSDLASAQHLSALDRLSSWYGNGKDATRIANDLLQVLRDLFIVMLAQTNDALAGKPVERYRAVADGSNITTTWVLTALTRLGELYTQMRYVEQPRLALETCLLTIAMSPRVDRVDAAEAQSQMAAPQPKADAETRSAAPSRQEPVAQEPETAPTDKRSERAAKRRAAGGGDRKRETLERLFAERDAELEEMVRSRWADVLDKVKTDRIQTHAWLAHGEVALVTGKAVVLSFGSRIHREAVMKAQDRQTIELAFNVILERDFHLLALLKTDWDEYLASLEASVQEEEAQAAPERDIVAAAVELFGADKVITEDEGS